MCEPCILLSLPVDMGRGDTLGFECLLLSSVSQSRLDPTPVITPFNLLTFHSRGLKASLIH